MLKPTQNSKLFLIMKHNEFMQFTIMWSCVCLENEMKKNINKCFLKYKKKNTKLKLPLRAAHKGPSRNLKTIPKEKKKKN